MLVLRFVFLFILFTVRRPKKELPVLEHIEITDVAAEGKAIAKVDNLVIFVPYVAPGDVVDIKLTRKKNNYAEGIAVKFHTFSQFREKPFCTHFETCGGCRWQHLNYEQQLFYKQKQVSDNLERIGKIPFPAIKPILGAHAIKYYRNKLEFTFSEKRWILPNESFEQSETDLLALGFHIPGRFDKVLDINTCYLQPELSNLIRHEVKKFCVENQLSFQNLKTHTGLMRNLIIRNSNTGRWMLVVVFGNDSNEIMRIKLLEHIRQTFPEISSLWYVVNSKLNDSISDLEPILHSGSMSIEENIMGLTFQTGPKAFMQTNSAQAARLYQTAIDFANLTGTETVYDLYTGTGTIANIIAKQANKVIGIEYVDEAVKDARINSKFNKIENTMFFTGDMKDVLTQQFFETHGHPDVIITDPPRAGMHNSVIECIIAAQPQKIVYVSCNPATQARDAAIMHPHYKIEKIQPVDMFPQTHHVENVILLVKDKQQ